MTAVSYRMTRMTDTAFRPFDTLLDRDTALRRLQEATAGADDGELFLERRHSEALVFDDGRVKTASFDAAQGFGLRAVRGEVSGYAHSSDVSEGALTRAVETARLAVGDGGGTMAPHPPRDRRLRPRPRSARGAGDRDAGGVASAGGHPAPLRHRSQRFAPDDAAQRVGDRRTGWPPRIRHRRRRRAAWAGWSDRSRRLAGQDPRGAARRPGQPAGRTCPGGRDGRGAWPRLARHPAPRGDRPRAGGRFQPQGQLGLRGPHGTAHCRPRRDGAG